MRFLSDKSIWFALRNQLAELLRFTAVWFLEETRELQWLPRCPVTS